MTSSQSDLSEDASGGCIVSGTFISIPEANMEPIESGRVNIATSVLTQRPTDHGQQMAQNQSIENGPIASNNQNNESVTFESDFKKGQNIQDYVDLTPRRYFNVNRD